MTTLYEPAKLPPETRDFYRRVLTELLDAGVPFLVGGAYAFGRYTGIVRHTKDFDIFCPAQDCERLLEVLARCGCQTDVAFPHWLAKARCGADFVDVIYGSGNGVADVDGEWFSHAVDDEVVGLPVKLCPAEEMLWSKAFVQERERYDGADAAHLIRARGAQFDWERLLRRFGPYWRVLFAHLLLFGFVYPGERTTVPAWVMRELWRRTEGELERPVPDGKLCRGTLLSREQYLPDVQCWGYADARLLPEVKMTADDIERWTAAIDEDGDGKR